MELFRSWGLEPRIRELELAVDFVSSVRSNLSGPELERRSLGFPTRDEARAFSPTWPALVAQDTLEPVLLEHARSYPNADIRFGTEVTDLEQRDGNAFVTIVNRATGEPHLVQATYVLAADGASSPIRRRLGIRTRGVERIGEYLSVLFRTDMTAVLGDELCGLYMLNGLGAPVPSVALPTGRDGRWVLATPWRSEARPVDAMTNTDFVELVRRAADRPDLAVDVLGAQLVAIGAEVAERFRDGNVFLVGDAAHRTAPTGGTGMNTAIQSAHNLAWKLAAVLNKVADPSLLDTYEPERRPAGERNLLRSKGELQGVSGVAADLGVVYSSSAVVRECDGDAPALVEPTDNATVGARLPHVWLDADGERISTLDLTGSQPLVLTGPKGDAWRSAARSVESALGISLGVTAVDVEPGDPSGEALTKLGIERDGALLVRPDGHIAWRSRGAAADPTATLEHAVATMLGFDADDRAFFVALMAAAGRRCA
jgi:2-polyprenyl-6-methoxyphenol hydroxylase-like FAD-dependent oxidoreductase